MVPLKYLLPILMITGTSVFWYSCEKSSDTKPATTAPTEVTTQPASGITQSGAVIAGNIGTNGGSNLLSRGVVYSKTNVMPTTGDEVELASGFDIGAFSVQLSNLDSSTKYYARSFAANAIGISYGQTVSFTTLAPLNFPQVNSLTTVTNIEEKVATFGGNVISDGGSPITARGVCWNTDGNPTVDLSTKTMDGTGTGSFTSTLLNLSGGTSYKVRAYATNAAGTAYGDEVSFTTSAATVSITFRVNMSNETVSPQGVHIAGSFQNPAWQPANGAMTNAGMGIWTYTASIPQNTTIEYKFINGNAWGNNEILTAPCGTSPDGNRTLDVGTSNQTVTFCYNRCDATCPPPSVTDIDGNVYQSVIIGTQTWMKQNLKTSKYRNGDVIPSGLSNSDWANLNLDACANYNNLSTNGTTYGKLYNHYAVVDSRGLCPVGWHVPTDAEWKTLEAYLGMPILDLDMAFGLTRGASTNIGGKLKSVSTLWTSPNQGANDQSNFSGLPGGLKGTDGNSVNLTYGGYFWTSSQTGTSAWRRTLHYDYKCISRAAEDRRNGFSVRCILD